MINVAVLGYGTVGSGIVEVINTNKEVIRERVGKEIKVSYVLDLREFLGDPVSDILVHDYEIIINDPKVVIIAEAMGGVEPAYSFAKKALAAGKHFCTSNKELVAKHGAELIELANENGVNFFFEASVGGGIPIIRPLISSLVPEKIEEITGILNGTTNYMMTEMSDNDLDFEDVLKDAQEKGYAERNPEADVEGYDACRKIAILASLAYGKQVDFQDIYTEGITKISKIDMQYAKIMKKRFKLLGSCCKKENKICAMVVPMLVGEEFPLYSVTGVNNAVLVKGNTLGDVMFYGAGAGKLPTASAVVSDIIEEARNLNKHVDIKWDNEKIKLGDIGELCSSFFVRIKGDRKELCEKIANLFIKVEEVNIGIESEYAFIVRDIKENEFKECSGKIGNIINAIRIKD